MKSTLALIVGVFVIASAGCGGGGGSSATAQGPQFKPPPASQYPTGNLSVSSVSYSNGWLTVNGNFPYSWPTSVSDQFAYQFNIWNENGAYWVTLPARSVLSHTPSQVVLDLGVAAPTYPTSGYSGNIPNSPKGYKYDTFVEYNQSATTSYQSAYSQDAQFTRTHKCSPCLHVQ